MRTYIKQCFTFIWSDVELLVFIVVFFQDKREAGHSRGTQFQLLTSHKHADLRFEWKILCWKYDWVSDILLLRLARVLEYLDEWFQCVRTNKQFLSKTLRRRKHCWHFSIVAQGWETKIESSWCSEDIWKIQWTIYSWWDVKQTAKYSGYLGTQGDPRRPNALFIIKSGPFTSSFELDQGWEGCWDFQVLAKKYLGSLV